MAYNHGKEEKEFKEQWKQKEKLYHEIGMTDEQISTIRKFDENAFKLDTYLAEYWTVLIDSNDKYCRLMKVPSIMRKAFYMYKVLGMYQDEISSELSIPQQTISYWISKIAEILK